MKTNCYSEAKIGDITPSVTNHGNYWQFTCIEECKSLFLHIYDSKFKKIAEIDMLSYQVSGKVYSVRLYSLDMNDKYYRFIIDGCFDSDGYERAVFPLYKWNEKHDRDKSYLKAYDFDINYKDTKLHLKQSDVIAYQLHVRGFTVHESSKVKNPGTFLGVTEKITYLKNLGINQVILMPAYEFDEIDLKNGKLNYWGFCKSSYFMPKAAYSVNYPQGEFRTMVEKMHKNGIEVVMQFYFPSKCNFFLIEECLKYWYMTYQVDGFYLIGDRLPVGNLCTNPVLTDAKLYIENPGNIDPELDIVNRNITLCSNDFMRDIRRFLKSDSDTVSSFATKVRNNPRPFYTLNFISNFNEFCLNDFVSYDFKHNEDNLEHNRDGNQNNYSWNCGIEGPTKKTAVLKLRKQQMLNAMAMLLLSQGTPMILSGDEWGDTRKGNNNPYCQDNEISWLNWKKDRTGSTILNFTKELIAFRKSHKILHMDEPMRLVDYKAFSYPDLSYHGEMAWYPKFEENVRNLGLLYCGRYAKNDDGKEDAYIYIAFNMHWEERDFGLPSLPKGRKWVSILDTDLMGKESEIKDYKESFTLSGRSVRVLISE